MRNLASILIFVLVLSGFTLAQDDAGASETGLEAPTKEVKPEIDPKMPKNDKKIFKNLAKWYGSLRQMALSSVSTMESVQKLVGSFQRHLNAALNISKRVAKIVQDMSNWPDSMSFFDGLEYVEENFFSQIDYMADYDIKELKESREGIHSSFQDLRTRGGEFKTSLKNVAKPVTDFAVSRRAGRSVNQRIDRQAREGDSATGTDIGVDIAQRAGETAQMEQGARELEGDISNQQLISSIDKQCDSTGESSVQDQASANKLNNENALQLYFREHGVYGTVVTSLSQSLMLKAMKVNGVVMQRSLLISGLESFLTEYNNQTVSGN
ncbi:MAG: hypothetical protein GX640_04140 [Fibrobacter sp.]|nr:hypothetical protein [Fibrobacter sp.]